MITGANTNVRHRGIIFHVQTEDSGRANPHVISHLYHHGTILSSQKTEYAEHLEDEGLEAVVRGLIDSQHRQMLERLKTGAYDALIDERLHGATTDGLEAPPTPETAADDAAPEVRPAPVNVRTFGEGIVSQKPLDEVILDYLADKARDRAADRAEKSVKTRSSG